MLSSTLVKVDFIEELRLRRWARENYVPHSQRSDEWHPVVLEEMKKKDGEEDYLPTPTYAWTEQ